MRTFGNPLLVREKSLEAWGWLWAERLWQDIRYALRGLRRNPGFSSVAILSLALGIGATTSMFSLIYAVLLHPVPYADWQQIAYPIYLNNDQPSSPEQWFSLTWPQYEQLRKVTSLADTVADDNRTIVMTGRDIPEQVQIDYFSENTDAFWGVPAFLGRDIQPSDAATALQQRPVVVSYDFWMRYYSGDRSIVGKTLELDHKPYNIIGVMPKDYTAEPDLYAPISLLPISERNPFPFMRVKHGVSFARADSEIDALLHQFARDTPHQFPNRFRMHLERMTDSVIRDAGHTLILLTAAVLMLLIIGCVNCSILLLARGMSRQSELAVRAAIGASRHRILRQLLVEAIVLAVLGSLFGILLAYWMAKVIFSLFPDVFLHESAIHINLPILAFSIALALLSGLAFGLLPSLRMSRPDLARVMQASARKVAGSIGQARALNLLIAAQIALTIIIMGAAGLAIGGFTRMTHRTLGYDPAHVMSVPVPLHEHSYLTREARTSYIKTLEEKIAAVPGVEQVAVSADAPPPLTGTNLAFEILGSAYTQRQTVNTDFVGPEYFSTLHIPLLQGRLWNEAENTRGAAVAVINETLAHRYFPNGDAIGRQLRTPMLTLQHGDPGRLVGVPDSNGWVQIIGVVADSLNSGLDKPVQPELYVPYTRFMWPETGFLIRTHSAPLATLHDVQRAILSVNSDQQVGQEVRDLSQWIEQQPEYKQQRLFSILFGLFSGLALALALAGLYSVVSYSVTQRTNEFGIRMALGARRTHILWIVCRNTGITVFCGLLAGILIFLTLQRFLAHWTQNSYSSPLVIVAAAALFILCTASACTIPALRATFIDPMQAVRYE
jgi:predicted permease